MTDRHLETLGDIPCDSVSTPSPAPRAYWLRAGAILLGYGVTINAMWWLSKELEVVPGAVSWFLPAGIRVSALVLTKPRHWWLLWLAEIIAFGAFTQLDFDFRDIPTTITSHVIPLLCYALPVGILSRVSRVGARHAYLPLPLIALSAVIGASLLGLNWTTILIKSGVVADKDWIETLFTIALGDMVGVCLALPFLALYTNQQIEQRLLIPGFIVAGILAIAIPQFLDFGPGQYYWRILLLVIVGVGAHRFGLIGASLTSWSTALLIISSHLMDGPLGTIQEDQFFIIFLTLSSLSLGNAISRQRLLVAQLNSGNKALAESSQELISLNREHQQLAGRLVDAAERERRSMAAELHDGLGQLLSSVQLKLQLLKNRSPDNAKELETLSGLVGTTYNTARALMYQLSPSSLLEMGLESALRSPELTTMLEAAGIDYQVEVQIPSSSLSNAVQLQLYRIVQEAVHNACKYADASHLLVRLTPAGAAIQLEVSDNGCGFDSATVPTGMGLRSIRDRAIVLGARYELQSDATGTRHCLLFST